MTRPLIRPLRITLAPSQEAPFQADRYLFVASTSGTVSLVSSSMNEIPGGLPLPPGIKLSGPRLPDGDIMPIGVVVFRNASAVSPAYIDVLTSNGDIDRSDVVGGSQIVERAGVYTATIGATTGPSNNIIASLALESPSSKRIRLLRCTIHNPGMLSAANYAQISVQRYAGAVLSGGSLSYVLSGAPANGASFTKRDPGAAPSEATLRVTTPTVTGGGVTGVINLYEAWVLTTIQQHRPVTIDLSKAGTLEPFSSDVGGALVFRGAMNHTMGSMTIDWTEE